MLRPVQLRTFTRQAQVFTAPVFSQRLFSSNLRSQLPTMGKRWKAGKKRTADGGSIVNGNKKKSLQGLATEGSNEEVLQKDVDHLLALHNTELPENEQKAPYEPPEKFSEIEVTIKEISSTGDGLALSPNSDHVYVVPFTAPGDVVKAKVVRYHAEQRYTITDFLSTVQPSPLRDDRRVQCPYFAKCSGCQFQMMDYQDQLKHKTSILERAYKNFSNLAPEFIPVVQATIGSPLQYGYRTKLTPHFDGPPGGRKAKREGQQALWMEVPPIGFMQKNTRRTIDIEDCPIGTDAVRKGMKEERARVTRDIQTYKRGATLLLRENTTRTPDTSLSPPYKETKTCTYDQNATTTEYVDSYTFTNPAGSFFQNNNSILPRFTDYIRQHILSPPGAAPPTASQKKKITHLLDAYSGSGLFTITLSPLFATSTGIDISPASIAYASKNAELNELTNTSFKAATASTIFDGLNVDPDETAVVIDPPRKGCDEQFLSLLLKFAPRRVVYVSCNVHTQARDVGILVEGKVGSESKVQREVEERSEAAEANEDASVSEEKKRTRYKIESLQGFDFFPQTGHVEGVAVLERVDD